MLRQYTLYPCMCYVTCDQYTLYVQADTAPGQLVRHLVPQLSLGSLQPVLCPKASELLVSYDEHVLVNNFKFGVIYQRVGGVLASAS